MTALEQFALDLRSWRRAAGLSQDRAARALGMDCTETLRSWEQGRCLPAPHVQFLVREFIRSHQMGSQEWHDAAGE